MTQVDFYVLADAAQGDRYHLAARLVNKAWASGHRILIHTQDAREAQHMDRLLWTWEEQSFIPHGLLGSADAALNPVLIGDGSQDSAEHDVLINLSNEVPLFFSRFERLAECVDHDPAARSASRERYKFYREHGYPLYKHDIPG